MADKDTKKKATVLDMSKRAPMLEKSRPPLGPGAALIAIRVPAISSRPATVLVLVICWRDYGAASSLRYMDRSVRVKFMGGREVAAALCIRRPGVAQRLCAWVSRPRGPPAPLSESRRGRLARRAHGPRQCWHTLTPFRAPRRRSSGCSRGMTRCSTSYAPRP